jgi:hypothetical protein
MILSLLFSTFVHAAPVKDLKLKPQDVGTVNTAIGYSTVIQLSSKPLNVVLGDQSAFRVEFINDSITIKPLRSGAKSNLFIFTDNDRFNLTVKTGSSASVDYVIRLRRTFFDPKSVTQLNYLVRNKDIRLKLLRVTHRDSNLFVDFTIQSLSKKALVLAPELTRILVDKQVRSVRSLYVDSITLRQNAMVTGSILFPSESMGRELTIWFGFRGEKPLSFSFRRRSNKAKELLRAL